MYWDLMGEYDSETTSFTAFAGGGGSSPYSPLKSGKLRGLRIIINRSAATSLINAIAVKLTCPLWSPNAIVVAAVGSGLQTAPALQQQHIDYQIDQPVEPGSKITLDGKNITADTPVTVSALVLGLFE